MSLHAIDLLPLVLLLPLVGVLTLVLFGQRIGGRASGFLATLLVGLAFLLSAAIAVDYFALPAEAVAHEEEARREDEAHAEEPGDEDEAHAERRRPAIVQDLWTWIAVREPFAFLDDDDVLRTTVALQPIASGERIEPEMVGEIDARIGSSEGLREALPLMWDREALLDAGMQATSNVPAGALVTSRLVPPLPDMMSNPDGRFQPAAPPGFRVEAALQLDGLSVLMLLVVTGVGFLIHVFSTGYMAHDPDRRRYFTYLNLFVFSMLVLVLGANFLVLFVGWELVGACSYLLIGFWWRDEANARAGRKAFLVNRVGDLAFLVALMMIWTAFGSLSFADVLPRADALTGAIAVAIPVLLLAGATGKSAQIPLYVWLPDAMAGPTPVSALIHAATMVTAGVYLIVRVNPLFENAPQVLLLVAVVGVATALVAALIATVQMDVKKVLAYSTISQLGFMFLAVGAGAYIAAVFHLMTHAFFKALLFLGAGSLMHAMEHGAHDVEAHPELEEGAEVSGDIAPDPAIPFEQDMRLMGGLIRRAPVTGWTFVIGSLALAGVAPLAGFFSKDEILLEVFEKGSTVWLILYGVALFAAFLTAYYTGRMVLMSLFGAPRSPAARHAAESGLSMTLPLAVLAFFTLVGGLPALGWFFGAPLVDALAAAGLEHHSVLLQTKILMGVVATVVALSGLGLAWWLFGRAAYDPAREDLSTGWRRAFSRGFFVDEAYHRVFVAPFVAASGWLWQRVDDGLIDRAVNGVGRLAVAAGQASRRWQSGQVRSYGLSILVGAVVLALYMAYQLLRAG